MNNHADHPQHDVMTAAIVNSMLSRNQNAEAAVLAETIRDPVQRAQLDQRLRRHGIILSK